jgi:hypothetical protein
MRKCEKMREWTDWKDIRVKKNYLCVLGEAKNVKFREDGIKIGATWEMFLEGGSLLGEVNVKEAPVEA